MCHEHSGCDESVSQELLCFESFFRELKFHMTFQNIRMNKIEVVGRTGLGFFWGGGGNQILQFSFFLCVCVSWVYHVLKTDLSVSSYVQLQRISLGEQVYVADNLAFFPYQVQDEPLFIIHQIDIIVSVAGSNLMQSFKEVRHFKSYVIFLLQERE